MPRLLWDLSPFRSMRMGQSLNAGLSSSNIIAERGRTRNSRRIDNAAL